MKKCFKRFLSLFLAVIMLASVAPAAFAADSDHIHNYGEPEWIWESDYSKATAVFTCKDNPEHIETVYGTDSGSCWSPNCTESGSEYHHASVVFEGEEYTCIENITIPPLGHAVPEDGGHYIDEHPHYFEYTCTRCNDLITDEEKTTTVDGCQKCISAPKYIDEQYTINVPYKSDVSALDLVITAHYEDYYVDITDKIEPFNYDSSTTGPKIAEIKYIYDEEHVYTTTVEYVVEYTWWQWIIRILFLGFIWY